MGLNASGETWMYKQGMKGRIIQDFDEPDNDYKKWIVVLIKRNAT